MNSLSAEQLHQLRRQKAQYQALRYKQKIPRKVNKCLLCEICGKNFKQLSSLNEHKLTHSGDRPHICDECGKCFSYIRSLQNHMKIHNRDKSTNSQERDIKCRISSKEDEPVPAETISNVCVITDPQIQSVTVEEGGLVQNCTEIQKMKKSLNVEEIVNATTLDNIAGKSLMVIDTVQVKGMNTFLLIYST